MNEETLFHLAMEAPPHERAAFLERACAGDPDLRHRVEALLRAHDNPGSFMEKPILDATLVTPAGDQPADRPPPSLPGDYEIVRELGRGGMGVVYLARQKSLGRDVAVKVLRPGETTFGPLVKRFLDEARHLAHLRHPNIVSIHEIGQAESEPYFTMDYVEGQPLSAKLARPEPGSEASRTRLPPSQALAILKQAAAGIEHAHAQGIIHRDLKPANILIDASGHAYVTDFGLARDIAQDSNLTRSGEVMGTPAYMAPEQARGQKEMIGEATDVHALGVILYEMLTGQLPYGGGSPADVIVRLITDEPVPPRKIDPRIPRDLETICLKAMAKTPDRRYASVRAFLEDIRRFESGEPVLARRPGLFFHARRFVRRHGKLAAAVLLTAGVLLALAPRLFDKSVDELVSWGNEQAASGQQAAALRTYARAYRNASGGERRHILQLILTAARSVKDPKEVGPALVEIVNVDPDVSFQEFDYTVGEAWGRRHMQNDLTRKSPENKRRLLEIAEKRLQLVVNGAYSSESEKQDAAKYLAESRQLLAMLETAPDLVFELPPGKPDELLAAADDPDAMHGNLWQRGMAAFSAGFELEKLGQKAESLAAYHKAYELMRRASPIYTGLSRGIDMNLPREKQHESKEPRLLQNVVRSMQRLDPATPDTLRGGIRFRVEGPQIPENEVFKLYAALWDPSVAPNRAGFGETYSKAEPVPMPPGSFPIQVDGTAWIGVADGKYRISVWRAEWGATGKIGTGAGAKHIELDFRGLPAEVEIHGQTIELPIRSYVLEEVALLAPPEGASLDLRTTVFRWSAVPKAKYFRIRFGCEEAIPGGKRTNFFYDEKLSETSICLSDLPPAERARFSILTRGSRGTWGVTPCDASNQMIGMSYRLGSFTVAHELGEK